MLSGVGAFIVTVVVFTSTVVYKPYGVPDSQMSLYKAKLARIEEIQRDNERAKITGKVAKVVCKKDVHDFGRVDPHTTMSYTFTIRNEGTAPLRLQAADTSCKCTLSDVENEWVEPNGETEVTLTYNAGSKAEAYRQYAVVRTNDPQRPELELVVKGSIKKMFGADVEEVVYQDVVGNDPVTRVFHLTSQVWPSLRSTRYSVRSKNRLGSYGRWTVMS